jgi:tetratricopeptide (TPR) repeat protein
MERAANPSGHSEGAPSSPVAGRAATFVQHGEDWTIGYEQASFPLRHVLGLTYIQRLLQYPGEQFHALDLLSGAAPGNISEIDPSRFARLRDDDNVAIGRVSDTGPILDEQAKRDYRRRISELNEELNELRERGNLNLLGERDYQRRAKIESEIEALTRQLAQAVGMFGRDRRSGSAAERARLNVTRAIRSAIQRISERNAELGDLLASCIKTGSFCSYIPVAGSLIEWKFALEGASPAPMTTEPALESGSGGLDFIHQPRSTTAFVGREQERELLRECLEEAKSGQGRIVILAGPPGIGKTRTAREAGNEARQHGFVALAGNCYDREDAVPFVPFVEVLEVVLARAPSPAAIREILGDQAAELSRLLPQVHRLFPDLPAPMQVSAEQARRMLFKAVVDLVDRQSASNPLLLLLEDLHWADEGTLSLLVHLARAMSSMPVMIIVTHRNDEIDMKPPLTKALDELTRLGTAEQIPLSGLQERDVAQMIELLSGHEPSPALVDLIYSNTDGNPLFVQELIRDLDQNQSNEDLVERLQQGEVALPHSLRLVIGRRLALVSREATRVMGTAAVIGRSFNFGLLEAATHAEPDPLVDSLEEAEKAGLISSRLEYPEARFRFSHELIRRAVLDEISVARRQRLHLNVAKAMEQVYANSLEEHAEDLAHHFWSAGAAADPSKTVRYLQIAGEKAVRSSANPEAIDHFNKALQLIDTLPETQQRLQQELALEIGLGTALIATKGFSTRDVVEVYARARDTSQRAGETAQLFRVLWGQWLSCANWAEYRTSLELGEQCLRVAREAGDGLLVVEAHHALGVSYCTMGEFSSALDHLEQVLGLYDSTKHAAHAYTYGQDPAVVCLIHSGFALWFLGYPDQALDRNDKALAMAAQLSHPVTTAIALAFAAQIQQFCRNPRAVERLAQAAVDQSIQHGLAFTRAMGIILTGWSLTAQGKENVGIETMRSGLEVLRATDAVTMMSYFSVLLAEAYGQAEQPEEGLSILAATDRAVDLYWSAEFFRVKGELILKRPAGNDTKGNDEAEAEDCFRQALKIARDQKAKSLELRAVMSLCRLWLQRGQRSEARLALEGTFRWFTEGLETPDLRDARTLIQSLSG